MMRLSALVLSFALLGGTSPASAADGTNVFVIDLPTTLQLVGARNLDVQIAREKLAEAKANNEGAVWHNMGLNPCKHAVLGMTGCCDESTEPLSCGSHFSSNPSMLPPTGTFKRVADSIPVWLLMDSDVLKRRFK